MSRVVQDAYTVSGRTVFITGAARGIGAATAARLHEKGANVVLVGLEPERLAENAARLGADRATWFEADVTDFHALNAAVAHAVDRFGGIDIAIANAGVGFVGTLRGAPVEQVERTFEVNLLGVWRTNRAVIDQIVERRGYLLNVASLAAITHAPLMAPYAATKAAVEAMTDVLRLEVAPTGAKVGCTYFGYIDTDLVKATHAHPAIEMLHRRTPKFFQSTAPLVEAVDAIDRGIEARADRIWAPRWVGAMIAMRGLMQRLTERRTLRDAHTLAEAVRLADDHPSTAAQDSVLGVSTQALVDRPMEAAEARSAA